MHAGKLKKAVGSSVVVAQLPDRLDSHQIPERVLQRRWGPNGASQGLILWSGLHPSLATWEDLIPLRQRFPRAPAWGQAACYREGNLSLSTRVDFRRPPGAAGGSSRVRGATAATEQCGDWWASRGDYSWAEKGNTPA
uniref:Uncharacterized protein n=1 Tax=Zea mays TaxID=4577 RepID=B6UBB7_MAIZE|nr:hypothetical protein [Zea mays]